MQMFGGRFCFSREDCTPDYCLRVHCVDDGGKPPRPYVWGGSDALQIAEKLDNCDCDPATRFNFDQLLWSVVTIFLILTGENWPDVLYDGMQTGGNEAALYFIAL